MQRRPGTLRTGDGCAEIFSAELEQNAKRIQTRFFYRHTTIAVVGPFSGAPAPVAPCHSSGTGGSLH